MGMATSIIPLPQQVYDFLQRPNMVRDSGCHRVVGVAGQFESSGSPNGMALVWASFGAAFGARLKVTLACAGGRSMVFPVSKSSTVKIWSRRC